jgi:hypothetical protein
MSPRHESIDEAELNAALVKRLGTNWLAVELSMLTGGFSYRSAVDSFSGDMPGDR